MTGLKDPSRVRGFTLLEALVVLAVRLVPVGDGRLLEDLPVALQERVARVDR